MFRTGLIGFLAEGIGLLLGFISLYVFNIKNKKTIGMLFSITSGMMLAMICFDILPEALKYNRIDLLGIGILIGVTFGFLLDEWVPEFQKHLGRSSGKVEKAGYVLMLGIALHNIPEGFSLGTVAHTASNTLIGFSAILALHSIPEGIALAIPFKAAGRPFKSICHLPIILGFFMGVGSLSGYLLSVTKTHTVVIMLGGAAGIILYIVYNELIPESKKIWNGRLTTIMTILGLLIGILLLS